MAKHDIEVTIDENGKIELHVVGHKGKGCLKLLDEFEKALGKRTGDARPTDEMYQSETQTQKTGR